MDQYNYGKKQQNKRRAARRRTAIIERAEHISTIDGTATGVNELFRLAEDLKRQASRVSTAAFTMYAQLASTKYDLAKR